MPNAKDIKTSAPPRILVAGKAGSGKTSQFLTLKGKKFAYLFDPNAIQSLQGHDVDYEEFLPDVQLGLTSLTKKTADQVAAKERVDRKKGAEVYYAWEEDYEKKRDSGFFDTYSWVCIDSFTTLSDMVMDGILAVNGRAGQWPQQDDYGPQMLTLTKIIRALTALGKGVYLTAHVQMTQDDTTKRIVNELIMTGRLKSKLPLLFSDLLILQAMSDQRGNTSYTMQTKPDRYNESCRCSVRDINMIEDITVDWSKSPIGQGIGKFFNK